MDSYSSQRMESDARIALANRLLQEHPQGTTEHEHGLALLQAIAKEDGATHARWLLGAYFLQVSSRSKARVHARRWLERSAADGTPPAVDRLADLHLSGMGAGISAAQAVSLQLTLANQGSQRAAWEAAYLIDTLGPIHGLDAATAFLRACALGYPPAYYSLGLRFSNGNGVVRDIGFGHALLRRAADAGYAGAAEAATRVETANDFPGVADDSRRWHAQLKDNLNLAYPILSELAGGRPGDQQPVHPTILQLERHLVSIGHPVFRLDSTGRARIDFDAARRVVQARPVWTWLSKTPRLATCRSFATEEECAHLINKVAKALTPAAFYRRGSSANENAEMESFDGLGHPITALHTDAVTRMLERRVSTMAQWPMEKLEPCSIICYRQGEQYLPHVDFFSDEQIAANERVRRDFGGQRIATFLLYLKAPSVGGQTSYLEAGVDVAGETGMGVIHYNITGDGRPDAASLHAGRPVVEGEKWLWRSTLRQHSLYGEDIGSGDAPS